MKKLIMFLVICIAFTGTASAALRVLYEFEGNVLDQSGNENDGVIIDDAYYGLGVFGQGLALDGTNNINEGPGLDNTVDSVFVSQDIIGMTEATITYWAAADSWSNNVVVQNNPNDINDFYPIYFQIYGQWWSINFNWSELNFNFPGSTDTAYHHFAITMEVDDGLMKVDIYVDGEQGGPLLFYPTVIDAPLAGTIAFDRLYIGSNSGIYSGWVGRIDEFAIYDTILSQAEVDDIMLNGVGDNTLSACTNQPSMDTNGDCKVDLTDFANFALEWLDCNWADQGDCL